eukprot:5570123-Pyramimonas_sp.AAC.1
MCQLSWDGGCGTAVQAAGMRPRSQKHASDSAPAYAAGVSESESHIPKTCGTGSRAPRNTWGIKRLGFPSAAHVGVLLARLRLWPLRLATRLNDSHVGRKAAASVNVAVNNCRPPTAYLLHNSAGRRSSKAGSGWSGRSRPGGDQDYPRSGFQPTLKMGNATQLNRHNPLERSNERAPRGPNLLGANAK